MTGSELGMTGSEVGMTFREVGMTFGENCLLLVEFCRVLVVEAGEAEVIALAGLVHSLVREECERVGIDELADLLY